MSGFPSSFYVSMQKTSNGWWWDTDGSFDVYLQVKKANGWDDYGGTATNNGSIKDSYKNGIKTGSASKSGTGYFNTGTVSVDTSSYPYAAEVSAFSYSDMTVSSTATKTPSVTVKDQYGVEIGSPTLSFTKNSYKYDSTTGSDATNDISFATGTGKVSAASGGYKANSYNIHYVNATVSATFRTTTAVTKSASLKMTYPQYTYTWNWKETNTSNLASPTDKSATATPYYGDTPSRPSAASSAATSYYTASKHWSGGSFATTQSATQDRTYTMTYTTDGASHDNWTYSSNGSSGHTKTCGGCAYNTTESHSGWTYSEITGNDTYHNKTCGKCKYNEANTTQHNYAATVITFAENGQSATSSKTCRTTGCGHVYSTTATVTGEVTTDPTCTEKGVTTYTAVSGFPGESNVKSTTTRTDVAALGHAWGTPTFSFAADGKTATASRTCKREGCSYHSTAQTAAATISSTKKTDPTCTVKGWTTYTATSPWGDGTTDIKDVQDIAALGHEYNTTTIIFAQNGQSATATRTCTRTGCTDAQAEHTQTQTLTWTQEQDGGITREVKTPATCLLVGIHRYTATSPFGDSVTAYLDVSDIPALGHDVEDVDWTYDSTHHWKICKHTCGIEVLPEVHGNWVYTDIASDTYHKKTCGTCAYNETNIPHEYGETEITFAADGKTATVSRTCQTAGCGHTQNATLTIANGGITTEITEDPTCTEMGTTTYTATSPFADDDTTDTLEVVDVEMLPHEYGDWEIEEATCVDNGSKIRTCDICGDEDSIVLPALGHDPQQTYFAPTDGLQNAGHVYFQCSRCEVSWAAESYDEDTGKYVIDETEEYEDSSAMEEALAESGKELPKVPTTAFNNYTETTYFEHDYSQRGASLKIAGPTGPYDFENDPNAGTSKSLLKTVKQGIRFTASMRVPEGVEIAPSDTGNCILDFGFIYSQATYVPDDDGPAMYQNKLKLEKVGTVDPDAGRVIAYKSSVTENNSGKPLYDAQGNWNWSGVSLHDNNQVLTFNILINVKAENWKKAYCVRPYIVYRYNGMVFTVYEKATNYQEYYRSVAYIAPKVLENPLETKKVKDFCREKIVNNLSYIPA